MKKRANLITRVALAATIFVTALAGVTPMTAKAAEKTVNEYTLTYDVTPTGSGAITVPENPSSEQFDITAVPGDDYTFSKWVIGTEDKTDATYSVKTTDYNAEKKLTATAHFTKKANTISIAADGGVTSFDLSKDTQLHFTGNLVPSDNIITGVKANGNPVSANVDIDTSKKGFTLYKSFFEQYASNGSVTVRALDNASTPNESNTVTINITDTPAVAVAAPTFSIANNSNYTLGDPISISTTTTGASIRYTFEANATPTTNYNKPFALENPDYVGKTYTLRAIAIANGETSDTSSVTFTVIAPSTTSAVVLNATPATNTTVASGSTVTFSVTASASSTTAIPSRIYYAVGSDPTTSSDFINYPTTSTITIPASWANLTQPITLKAFAVPSNSAYSQSAVLERQYTIGSVTGTEAKVQSFSWNSNSDVLGSIGGSVSYHDKTTPTTPAIVYQVSAEKHFDNGVTRESIISEIDKARDLSVKLTVGNSEKTFKLDTFKWLYDYTEGENKPLTTSTYNRNTESKQEYYIYSEPIKLEDGTTTYNVKDSVGGPTNYVRLKLHVVVDAKDANKEGSTGSNPPTNLTFTPGEGTYVTPGSLITFSATASSGTVSYRSTNGNNVPSTSSGTQGDRVAIPRDTNAGDYKMNVIAYTSSSNSTTKSATFKVVNNNKYNVTYDNGVLTCDGNLSDFKGLWIQGTSNYFEFVPATNYTTASGSTIVTLTPTYLNSQTGSKVVRMVYTDGYAEGNFTLTAGATNAVTPLTDLTTTQTSNSTSSGGGRSGVGTDDRSDLVIMFVLLGMLIAGFVVSVYYKNEKLRRNRYMD